MDALDFTAIQQVLRQLIHARQLSRFSRESQIPYQTLISLCQTTARNPGILTVGRVQRALRAWESRMVSAQGTER